MDVVCAVAFMSKIITQTIAGQVKILASFNSNNGDGGFSGLTAAGGRKSLRTSRKQTYSYDTPYNCFHPILSVTDIL